MQPRGEAPVLMIVLARPELLDRRPNWGGGRLNHLALALEPLPGQAIADLVRHLLETDAPDVIQLVAERSEGNPFYAGELARSYLEHGSLEGLPDTVQATVLARLDLLPPDERRVLQLGAVYGRAFRASGVAALEYGTLIDVDRICESLADRDLVRPAEGDRYTFRHILIQEVAYNTLPRSERARLHAAAARWVESISEGRAVAVAEILAFHYREAAVLRTALDPTGEETRQIRGNAAKWLLKASDVAAMAGATLEAIHHIRASFDFVDPGVLPRLHERIGDLDAGDSGLEEYRVALELYETHHHPVDDQLRALAGMLMVTTRWAGSVGDRPSEEWMVALRARGRRLMEQATSPYAIGRFLAADAFFPFWIQGIRDPDPEMLAEAQVSADRALQMATELDDPELASAALDAVAGLSTAVNDWEGARDITMRRLSFEDKVGFYERLDGHSMIAWMSYLMGDLMTGDRDSAQMVARLLPGQAPFPALHLYAWRSITLYTLGRWDEAVAMFWRAHEAWDDAGRHAAGYGMRGFATGLEIGRGRSDARLIGAATDAMESIVARFPAGNTIRAMVPFIRGESGLSATDPFLKGQYPWEHAEKRFCLACDRREQLPATLLDQGLGKAVRVRVPLLEAQIRRAIALARHEPSEMQRAIEIWERLGAQTHLHRARAEHGLLVGDSGETDSALAALKKIGDSNYVDRFSTSLPSPG